MSLITMLHELPRPGKNRCPTLIVCFILLLSICGSQDLFAQSQPNYYVPSDLFPPIGRYMGPPESGGVTFASVILVKNIVLRNQSIIDHPPTLGNTLTYTSSGKVDYTISTDGGGTWQNGTSTASCSYSLYHQSDAEGIKSFVAELYSCSISGGDLPYGFMLRESPTLLSSGRMELGGGGGGGGIRINSFFDIYWELTTDNGSSWIPASGPMRLTLYVPGEAESSTNVILPPSGVYRSKAGTSIQWASGILARKFAWSHFTGAIAPPSLGGSTTNSFGSQLDFEYSTDGGLSWSSVHASPNDGLQITSTIDDGTARFFNLELTSMLASGVGMPPSMQIRESPTRVSMGGHSCHTVTGGYEEESFFDVFLEISVDGGASWSPLTSPPLRLEIDVPPSHILATAGSNGTISPSGSVAVPYDSLYTFVFSPDLDYYIDSLVVDGVSRIPSSNYTFSNVTQDHTIRVAFAQAETSLASPNYFVPSDYFPQMGKYVSPWYADRVLFASGIAIMNMVLRNQTMVDHPPALGHSKSYSTSGQMDYAYSTDGGTHWMWGTSPATSSFNLYQSDSGSIKTFELELASCTITGGDLPVSVSIRESPTRRSAGQMELGGGGGGGCRVNSFFDAYWEISTDGALTWTPASDSIRLTLYVPGEEQNTLDLFPPVGGQFDSKPLNWAMWPNGMMVKNCHWHGWSASVTPPAPGFSLSHTCSSTLDFDYSLDGGLTFSPASAPANLSVLMTSTVNDGSARFFDLELTALSVSGGGMPSNMLIRESPPSFSQREINSLRSISQPPLVRIDFL